MPRARASASAGPSPSLDIRWSQRLAELIALSGFAIAQPVLATFGTSPDTFIFRDASSRDIVLFALVVALLPPLVVWGVESAIGVVARRAQPIVHVVVVGAFVGLVAVQGLKQATSMRGLGVVAFATGVGCAAALLYTRWEPARRFLRVAAIAPVLFVLLFLFSSSVAPLVSADDSGTTASTGGGRAPSVALVVFDEWPTASVIDAEGQIDTALYPHLGALAGTATWYRNATTISNSTRYAVPAILTGRLQRSDLLPVAASQPKNLFSLFAPTHRLEAFESVTGLCSSPRRCHRARASGDTGLRGLLSDAARTFGRRIAPSESRIDVTTQFVEQVSQPVRERDFAALTSRQQILARAVVNRPDRFVEFLRSFHRNEQPTLHVLHVLLPHVPLRFLPSGLEYPAPVPEIGRQGDVWSDGEYPVALTQQRALLQTAYVDRLIGQLTARLRALGLFDRSVVALTADHGIAYAPGEPSRALTDDPLPRDLYSQLLWAPLVVKAPGQHASAVSDDNVMSIDVVPTLASLADVPMRWAVDGKVAGTCRSPIKVFQRAHSDRGGGRVDPVERFDATADFGSMLAHNVDTVTVSGDPRWQPWRLRPWGAPVGTRLDAMAIGGPSTVAASLEQSDDLQHVEPATGSVPALVWGTASRDAEIAVAVNGVIAGVSPTFTSTTPLRFAVMVPEWLLHRGANRVRLFEIDREGPSVTLHPIGAA